MANIQKVIKSEDNRYQLYVNDQLIHESYSFYGYNDGICKFSEYIWFPDKQELVNNNDLKHDILYKYACILHGKVVKFTEGPFNVVDEYSYFDEKSLNVISVHFKIGITDTHLTIGSEVMPYQEITKIKHLLSVKGHDTNYFVNLATGEVVQSSYFIKRNSDNTYTNIKDNEEEILFFDSTRYSINGCLTGQNYFTIKCDEHYSYFHIKQTDTNKKWYKESPSVLQNDFFTTGQWLVNTADGTHEPKPDLRVNHGVFTFDNIVNYKFLLTENYRLASLDGNIIVCSDSFIIFNNEKIEFPKANILRAELHLYKDLLYVKDARVLIHIPSKTVIVGVEQCNNSYYRISDACYTHDGTYHGNGRLYGTDGFVNHEGTNYCRGIEGHGLSLKNYIYSNDRYVNIHDNTVQIKLAFKSFHHANVLRGQKFNYHFLSNKIHKTTKEIISYYEF